MTSINKYAVCIIALQRSGHHAIINWIIENRKGQYCFLNNCKPGINPYLDFTLQDSFIGNIDLKEEGNGNLSYKDLFIHNYEDRAIPSIFSPSFIENKQNWIGRTEKEINIIVLRDPFNNFASKYKWAISGTKWMPSLESIHQLPALWKTYAREFLGITNHIPEPKLFINYNKWFSDPSYREQIANHLFLKSSDLGLKEVAKWGPNTWGGSFDNLDYDGRANEMKVLERWKAFSKNEFYKSLFKDPELIELSKEIFGILPETEELYKQNY